MDNNPQFLVERILPVECVHLVAGPSGAGKTTFMFQFILDWSSGTSCFGFDAHPLPYAYIALDRKTKEIEDRIKAAGLPLEQVPLISMGEDEDVSLHKVIAKVPQGTRVLFIDGFQAMMMDGQAMNDYVKVRNFMAKLNKVCSIHSLTIFGITHATKTKANERFFRPRDRIVGSVAWAGMASTIILVDPENDEDVENKRRIVTILPRMEKNMRLEYELGHHGRFELVEANPVVQLIGELTAQQTAFLMNIPTEDEITSAELEHLAISVGISRSTMFRYLTKFVELGIINKNGSYYKRVLD